MTIRLVKHETGDYTYDTETREWTKSSIMKDRLKNVLGIEIQTKNPIDVELSLDSKYTVILVTFILNYHQIMSSSNQREKVDGAS
jgi:hypothetical protein